VGDMLPEPSDTSFAAEFAAERDLVGGERTSA
jgi:hypothetical protein